MPDTHPGIEFDAIVYKVQTLVDMGLRVTFDLPEDAIEQAALLMACKRNGLALHILVIAADANRPQEQNLMNLNNLTL